MQKLNRDAWIFLSKQRGYLWGDVIRLHYLKFYIDIKLMKGKKFKLGKYLIEMSEGSPIKDPRYVSRYVSCPPIFLGISPICTEVGLQHERKLYLLIPKELAPKTFKPKIVYEQRRIV